MVYDCFILIKRRKMTGETHPRRIHISPTLYIYYCHCLFKCDCLLSMLETWQFLLHYTLRRVWTMTLPQLVVLE